MAHAGGRPSSYTEDIANKICAQLASGKSLNTVCKAKDMPSMVTVFSWFQKFPEFLKKYEQAKIESADMMIEDMHAIADDTTGDTQRDRLRVDTRKWIASKLKPKKYGEKIDMTSNGNTMGVILYPTKNENPLATDTTTDTSTIG